MGEQIEPRPESTSPPTSSVVTKPSHVKGIFDTIRAILLAFIPGSCEGENGDDDHTRAKHQIEDYPGGYPQFSALIASHDSLHICRRFAYLRTRILLMKQDQLSELEQRLWKVDQEEDKLWRLGGNRTGNDIAREKVLLEMDVALADYDALVERNHRMFSLKPATTRNLRNLRNRLNENRNISGDVIDFLSHSKDLVDVRDTDDTFMGWLEFLVEDIIVNIRQGLGENRDGNVSRDTNVHIIAKSTLTRITRVLMTLFIIVFLLALVFVCDNLDSMLTRLCMVSIATTAFVAVLFGFPMRRRAS